MVRARTFGALPWVVQWVFYFEIEIPLIFCMFWSEQIASFFSGFSVRLSSFVQANTLCRYGCMHFLAALV